ncbi:hypothetical protein D3Y57_14705 [Sphingomonas paeninsulae]|jgi:hypothetical protein|uniref:Uncharacterized protein n=1 Tax=Sphingomonas paeninsulae TaxID=2319844 RepID=A0A494TBY3_SPHPE|nr:hypothetical protein [Sphingomonas paeninsulae]AYJ86959.1 hypothetical protein D3Y57_14705 [Sphingomonas paeninsulae]
MSIDQFQSSFDNITAASRAPFAILPHDTNELATIPKAIYVGTGGNITLRGVDGAADVVLKNVGNGQILDIRARYVRVTGTTAADIVGLG